MSEMAVMNRFWVMKTLPDGNDFQNSLEMREENKNDKKYKYFI